MRRAGAATPLGSPKGGRRRPLVRGGGRGEGRRGVPPSGWRRTLAAAAVLALLASCGGGGGGGPTQPPPPAAGIAFTPATGGGGGASINLVQGAGTNANTLVLELRASGVQSLFGVAFDLSYPANLLTFTRATEGTFLSTGGAATSFQVAESTSGNLVVGLSQLGALAGMDGSGLLLSLEFTAVTAGTGTFAFANPLAFLPDGRPQNVSWRAGTVRVTR